MADSKTSRDNNNDAIETSKTDNHDNGIENSDKGTEKQQSTVAEHDSHSARNDGTRSVNTRNFTADTNDPFSGKCDSLQAANAGSTVDVNTTEDQESLIDDDKESVLSDMDEFVPVNPSKDGKRLVAAAKKQDFAMLRTILIESPDVKINSHDDVGKTIVHLMCALPPAKTDGIEIIKLCLEKKPNLNKTDKLGWTPLHYASIQGNVDMAQLLADSGANCNIPDSQRGRTPLHLAVSRSHKKVVDVLLECGANPCVKDKSGKTARDISKNEYLKDILETAVEETEYANSFGEVQLETMTIPLDKPTAFSNLGLVVQPQPSEDADLETIPPFKLTIRRITIGNRETEFKIADTEEICSDVFTYKIRGTAPDFPVEIGVPIQSPPAHNEDIVLKTDKQDEYTIDNITEENERWTCAASVDIKSLNSFIMVCRPKLERFEVGKQAQHIKSAVDNRVELDIPKNTFDKQVTITMEITDPPPKQEIAKVLEQCTEIVSLSSFYSLEAEGKDFSKPIAIKLPLPTTYTGNGKLDIMSMDDPHDKEQPDSWNLLDVATKITGGRVEFVVSSFSIKVAIERSSKIVSDNKTNFGSVTNLRSQVSRVFRKSRRKEQSVSFFCMSRRVSTSNTFKIIIQCCKSDQKNAKIAFWEADGFEVQTQKDGNLPDIQVIAKSRFKVKSKSFDISDDETESVVEFHPKLDNYQSFIVKNSGQKGNEKGAFGIYKMDKRYSEDDLQYYYDVGDKVAIVEVTMLKFHPGMVSAMDGRSFLTYRWMLQLQDDIGEHWWKVFLFMDIPFKKIEATLKENPGNVNETVNGLLFDWRESNINDKSKGIPILFSALHRSGMTTVMNDMQVELRKWKNDPANSKDGFYAWLMKAYKYDLLIPTHYDKPMSDIFLTLMVDQFKKPSKEFTTMLALPQGTVTDILCNKRVYVTEGLKVMKLLDLYRRGIPNTAKCLDAFLFALQNAKMKKPWEHAVMTTRAWLKRAPTEDSLKADIENMMQNKTYK